jgi:hypothetical protein
MRNFETHSKGPSGNKCIILAADASRLAALLAVPACASSEPPFFRYSRPMKAHHICPLHSASIENLEQLIKAGIMVTHGTSVALTNKGRAFTKRQMPY